MRRLIILIIELIQKMICEGEIGNGCQHEGRTVGDIANFSLVCKLCSQPVMSVHTDLGVYYFSYPEYNKINFREQAEKGRAS